VISVINKVQLQIDVWGENFQLSHLSTGQNHRTSYFVCQLIVARCSNVTVGQENYPLCSRQDIQSCFKEQEREGRNRYQKIGSSSL